MPTGPVAGPSPTALQPCPPSRVFIPATPPETSARGFVPGFRGKTLQLIGSSDEKIFSSMIPESSPNARASAGDRCVSGRVTLYEGGVSACRKAFRWAKGVSPLSTRAGDVTSDVDRPLGRRAPLFTWHPFPLMTLWTTRPATCATTISAPTIPATSSRARSRRGRADLLRCSPDLLCTGSCVLRCCAAGPPALLLYLIYFRIAPYCNIYIFAQGAFRTF